MQKKTGIKIGFVLFVALACLVWFGSSQAQDYPKSQIQIVIPYSPGGLTDIFYRSISRSLPLTRYGVKLGMTNREGTSD